MKNTYLLGATFLSLFVAFSADAATTKTDSESLFKGDTFFGQVRYRYENVEQDNTRKNANAHTIRTNLGYKTGQYRGFSGLVEGQLVRHIGQDDFNSLDNNQTGFSVVADPETIEVNRAYVQYTGIPDTTVKVGRQFLNLDNQRFIGTVGWRQNDQTFDAVTLVNKSIDDFTLHYSYVNRVDRIFEGTTPPDDLDTKVHVFNASYAHADWLKASAYGYFMEFDDAQALSNQTLGLRATGKMPINDDWTFGYEAEVATQSDHGENPTDYDENYYHIAPKISGHGFTFGAGYEMLQGNGTTAFKTPLATLHKFNGWADIFLNTPANGLEDMYVMGAYKVSNTDTILDGTTLKAIYHDFQGEEAGDFGSELDLSVGKSFTLPDFGQGAKKASLVLKYADYNADDAPYVDTEKFWLQLGVKF